jgi:uncharacterized membrane protein YkvA (DUF1232 family)
MNKNFFSEIALKFKLTVRLVKDPRISIWLKLIPAFCLFYLIVPVDILVGPIDDAIVIYLGMDLFIDFCPKDVVEEHLSQLHINTAPSDDEEIIEAEFKE